MLGLSGRERPRVCVVPTASAENPEYLLRFYERLSGRADAFGPQLEGMRDCLGFLPGSACPHYDGEERRRPIYQELVANGFPSGLAADDCVGLHFVGTEFQGAISAREGAAAYRVSPEGEETIEPRLLEKE